MKKKNTLLKLESDLLDASEPYSICVGDDVRDIDPRSPHYHATGRVVNVDYEGNIVFQVTNWGATYKPGHEVVKKLNQVMKILTNPTNPENATTGLG